MISHDFAPRSDAMKQTSIRNKQHRQRGVAKGLDLQFDHVAAARFTDDGRPDLRVVLVERADVARIVEVVMHCLMVSKITKHFLQETHHGQMRSVLQQI